MGAAAGDTGARGGGRGASLRRPLPDRRARSGGRRRGLGPTRHSFSFGEHYDPDRVGFGPLLALNDETVRAGTGYPEHLAPRRRDRHLGASRGAAPRGHRVPRRLGRDPPPGERPAPQRRLGRDARRGRHRGRDGALRPDLGPARRPGRPPSYVVGVRRRVAGVHVGGGRVGLRPDALVTCAAAGPPCGSPASAPARNAPCPRRRPRTSSLARGPWTSTASGRSTRGTRSSSRCPRRSWWSPASRPRSSPGPSRERGRGGPPAADPRLRARPAERHPRPAPAARQRRGGPGGHGTARRARAADPRRARPARRRRRQRRTGRPVLGLHRTG